MNKDLLHQGFNFATACFDVGIDATPVTAWLSEQARLGIGAAPATVPAEAVRGILAGNGAGAPTPRGNFDDAVLTAVRSSLPNGVEMFDLVPILKDWNRPNNQIGAALTRLEKKGLIQKRGNLWRMKAAGGAKIDKTIDQRRTRKKTGTGRTVATPAAGAAETATDQPAAAAAETATDQPAAAAAG